MKRPSLDTVGIVVLLLLVAVYLSWRQDIQNKQDANARATFAAYPTSKPNLAYNPNAKHEAQADRDATEWALERYDGESEKLCLAGCTSSKPGCLIKGNVSLKGEKIYHMPGDEYYSETIINPAYGERWFCNPDDAEAMGWRRARK